MRELLEQVDAWSAAGKKAALATVVRAWGSAPRPVGAKMAISSDGEMAGSVSGGCVEGAVVEEALEVLDSGRPKLSAYGVSNDLAWSLGLSCGGSLDVWIEPFDPASDSPLTGLRAAIAAGETRILATVVSGAATGAHFLFDGDGGLLGSNAATESQELDRGHLTAAARERLAAGTSALARIAAEPEPVEVFFDVFLPPAEIVILGAVHVAIHLIRLARELDFRTVVIDPRAAFATAERFAGADELLGLWPGEALAGRAITEGTYFALLAHDLKIELPALEVALRSPARYIGALGSKKTHAKRVAALEEAGFSAAEIARIHNPIGLDLGGRRAEEIALAVLAEIVAARYGKLPELPELPEFPEPGAAGENRPA